MFRDVPRHHMVVWIALIAISLFTLFLAEDGQAWPPKIVTTGLLSMGFLKARLIILHFMEFADGPVWLRIAGEAWVAVTFAVVLGLYLS